MIFLEFLSDFGGFFFEMTRLFLCFSGLDILPHISKSRPNLVENHLSLILHCLLKCDLPNVLVRVIVDTEEISLSVSSTVLLGELLHLANLLLPREVSVSISVVLILD